MIFGFLLFFFVQYTVRNMEDEMNTAFDDSKNDEGDDGVCRICHDESSTDDPLYYPCK